MDLGLFKFLLDLRPNPNPFLLAYPNKEFEFEFEFGPPQIQIQIHAIQIDQSLRCPSQYVTSHHMPNACFVASTSPSTYPKSKMLHSFKKLLTPDLYLESSEFQTFHKEENYMANLLRL